MMQSSKRSFPFIFYDKIFCACCMPWPSHQLLSHEVIEESIMPPEAHVIKNKYCPQNRWSLLGIHMQGCMVNDKLLPTIPKAFAQSDHFTLLFLCFMVSACVMVLCTVGCHSNPSSPVITLESAMPRTMQTQTPPHIYGPAVCPGLWFCLKITVIKHPSTNRPLQNTVHITDLNSISSTHYEAACSSETVVKYIKTE
jgi:hypothetical protein